MDGPWANTSLARACDPKVKGACEAVLVNNLKALWQARLFSMGELDRALATKMKTDCLNNLCYCNAGLGRDGVDCMDATTETFVHIGGRCLMLLLVFVVLGYALYPIITLGLHNRLHARQAADTTCLAAVGCLTFMLVYEIIFICVLYGYSDAHKACFTVLSLACVFGMFTFVKLSITWLKLSKSVVLMVAYSKGINVTIVCIYLGLLLIFSCTVTLCIWNSTMYLTLLYTILSMFHSLFLCIGGMTLFMVIEQQFMPPGTCGKLVYCCLAVFSKPFSQPTSRVGVHQLQNITEHNFSKAELEKQLPGLQSLVNEEIAMRRFAQRVLVAAVRISVLMIAFSACGFRRYLVMSRKRMDIAVERHTNNICNLLMDTCGVLAIAVLLWFFRASYNSRIAQIRHTCTSDCSERQLTVTMCTWEESDSM